MALRGPEAMDYLRLKQTFLPSDCNAVYSDGRVLPVLIRSIGGKTQCAVEISDQLYEPEKSAGFLRFELKPVPQVEPPPAPPQPTPQEIFNERMCEARKANPGENELALRLRVSEQLSKEALAERQRNRQGQQDLTVPDRWKSFAQHAQIERNARFRQ
jgi:hypothetical protein